MGVKDKLEKYRTKEGLTWEDLFKRIEDETGYPCPHGTWVAWLYGKGFSRAAEGVIGKWLERIS